MITRLWCRGGRGSERRSIVSPEDCRKWTPYRISKIHSNCRVWSASLILKQRERDNHTPFRRPCRRFPCSSPWSGTRPRGNDAHPVVIYVTPNNDLFEERSCNDVADFPLDSSVLFIEHEFWSEDLDKSTLKKKKVLIRQYMHLIMHLFFRYFLLFLCTKSRYCPVEKFTIVVSAKMAHEIVQS